jgi:hypothetical protein
VDLVDPRWLDFSAPGFYRVGLLLGVGFLKRRSAALFFDFFDLEIFHLVYIIAGLRLLNFSSLPFLFSLPQALFVDV